MSPPPTYRMNTGASIPALGLGMYRMRAGREAESAVRHALSVGYRLFDSAAYYRNERSLGRVIREGPGPREEILVTTKVWNSDHGYREALRAFERSFERLGLDYIDLYLIHWPVEGHRIDTWRALETLVEDGRCRAIGVSNYMVHHLEELFEHGTIPPAVNQIELHPWNYRSRKATIALCRAHGILVEAYSPLTKGVKLRDPRLHALAMAEGRTPAQILLRWGLDHGFIEIPKASRPDHIEENAALFDFELSEATRNALDGFDQGLATSWDPSHAP